MISKSKHFRVDGKASYSVDDPPDSFLGSLEFADIDCYPNICQLLIIGCVSPIGSTEVEREESGVRRLKTPYRTIMSGEREGDLNLIQLQKLAETDDNIVIEVFIQLHSRRLFTEHLLRLRMKVKITFSFYLLKISHLDMINLVVDFVI